MAGNNKKVIAIVGATGVQGGSLARAILNEGSEGEFSVRAITRNTMSEKAIQLQNMGAAVVQADINDEASITEAVKGAYGMFCVTLFTWDKYDADMEIRQATNMAKAAKNAGVQHVIWSTLEDVRKKIPITSTRVPTIGGRFKVPFFDAKGESDKFFVNLPTTYLVTSFFWENFINLEMGPRKDLALYYLSLPIGNKKLSGIGSEDVGKCALGIFKQPEEYIKKRVGIAGEQLTLKQMAQKMSKAMDKNIQPYVMSFDEYRQNGGDEAFTNMFRFYHDFESDVCSVRRVDEATKLNPDLMNFDKWLALNNDQIPLK